MNSVKTLTCPQCQQDFKFIPTNNRRKYCSYKCKRKFNYQPDSDESRQRYLQSPKGKAVKKRKEFKRRCSKKNVQTELVDLNLIAKRDKYKCHICRKRVNMDLEYNNRYSPTFDHLVPVSLGGNHTYANIRLAHRTCNSSKGNRAVNEQLLLFG